MLRHFDQRLTLMGLQDLSLSLQHPPSSRTMHIVPQRSATSTAGLTVQRHVVVATSKGSDSLYKPKIDDVLFSSFISQSIIVIEHCNFPPHTP